MPANMMIRFYPVSHWHCRESYSRQREAREDRFTAAAGGRLMIEEWSERRLGK